MLLVPWAGGVDTVGQDRQADGLQTGAAPQQVIVLVKARGGKGPPRPAGPPERAERRAASREDTQDIREGGPHLGRVPTNVARATADTERREVGALLQDPDQEPQRVEILRLVQDDGVEARAVRRGQIGNEGELGLIDGHVPDCQRCHLPWWDVSQHRLQPVLGKLIRLTGHIETQGQAVLDRCGTQLPVDGARHSACQKG
mmetsp:Transcript_34922/g.62403  ORF Transcript_34922/g.62403 Transcript_34922/m.62403 type:complete len:201 (-) Transcript_34922:527-1129(-)